MARKKSQLAKERLPFEQQNRQYHRRSHNVVLDDELLRRQQSNLDVRGACNGVVGNWLNIAQKIKWPTQYANRRWLTYRYEAELNRGPGILAMN